MVVIVMGVSGAGKTTIGQALAGALGWTFVDADGLHPAANIAKMARNEPLTDADRDPWLARVRDVIAGALAREESLVVACSALKARYRARLAADDPLVGFVYLKASEEVLSRRLADRPRHFAGPGLLASQLASLEEPRDAMVVDADRSPAAIVDEVKRRLNL
jgi:carbohydrate kinase (thermoresistant glucokinase family)